MLALIPLLMIWTGTDRQLCDRNAVDVSCGARHIDSLFGDFVGAASRTIYDKHSKAIVRSISSR